MSDRVDNNFNWTTEQKLDMPCRLYLWTSSCSLYGCGHISLELPNHTYISFWPEDGVGCCKIKYDKCKCKCYKNLWDEIQERGYPDKLEEIYHLDVNAITKWWNKFINGCPMYDLWTQNCASVVLTSLRVGDPWFMSAYSDKIKTPRGIFDLVTYGFNNDRSKTLNWQDYGQYVLLWFWWFIVKLVFVSCNYIFKQEQRENHKHSSFNKKVNSTEAVSPRHFVNAEMVEHDKIEYVTLGNTEVDKSELLQALQTPSL